MTKLTVELLDSDDEHFTNLELNDSGFDSWKDLEPDKLISASGRVQEMSFPNGLRCIDGIDLLGLSWGSEVGSTGDCGTCELCGSPCDPEKTWVVKERD